MRGKKFYCDIDGVLAVMLSQTGFKPFVEHYTKLLAIPDRLADYSDLIVHPVFQDWYSTHEEKGSN
ncbi:hypothetical protein [Tengunoibacter tsumagoiensis]|uniref:Uncharacterized protein n=1 Tax=Tengunoibacter tsumagoiensis TaxID=2014871 RepID=A0A402A7D6_9CHLR|nr:hypothetical protein [Tengunoibacter tsumagoiensis]GCE15043.1 hypothetical protein KTT_49020 [Tengunoibacter tsumagoiensis]